MEDKCHYCKDDLHGEGIALSAARNTMQGPQRTGDIIVVCDTCFDRGEDERDYDER